LPVVIHDTAGTIPDEGVRRAVQAESGVEAFYDGKSRTINIMADRVGSREDAERLLRHKGCIGLLRGRCVWSM